MGNAPDNDDPPPPYSEAVGYDFPSPSARYSSTPYSDDEGPDHQQASSPNPPSRRLGLLNGRYEIRPLDYTADDGYPLSLVLTLDGDRLWGSIDLMDFSGIISCSTRPFEASDTKFGVLWRGYFFDEDGIRQFREGTRACPDQYLSFLGDGEICGGLRYGSARGDFVEFVGFRISGQETRSEISPWSMREEWEDLGTIA